MCVCVVRDRRKGEDESFSHLGSPQPDPTSREKSLANGNKSCRSGHIAGLSPKSVATWCFPPAGADEPICPNALEKPGVVQ